MADSLIESRIVAALAANTEDLHGLLTSLMVGVMLIQLLCTPMTFAAKARPTSCPTVLSIGRLHLGCLLLLPKHMETIMFQQEQEPAEVLATMASSIESRMWVSLWSAICCDSSQYASKPHMLMASLKKPTPPINTHQQSAYSRMYPQCHHTSAVCSLPLFACA
jgi:hypothetical protein